MVGILELCRNIRIHGGWNHLFVCLFVGWLVGWLILCEPEILRHDRKQIP